ncbi:MAG: radical SAM protein [Elusimicrobiota bacterium]|nr:radical SAM protein [Elusimicrobiota bacterium]
MSRPFAPDKIFAHKDRVAEWLATGRSRPVTVELDMTNACNQKCPHCFGFYPERDQARLCLGEAKAVLDQLADAGARGVTFTGGGDPLVNPDTIAAVAHARARGLDVGFITNAQRLRPEDAAALVRDCTWLRVSLDAATPAVFRLTHGMGAAEFEKVLESVRLLARLKRETGSAMTLGVGFLTSPATKADVHAFARLGRELGADYAQYRPLLRRHGEPEQDYSDPDILAEMLRARADFETPAFRVLCSEHKYRLIEKGELGRPYKKCYGQDFAAVVGADRKMYVCCHMRGVAKYEIGDLAKATVAEVWDSEKRRAVADSVDFKDCPPLCRCDSFNQILWELKDEGRPLKDAPEGPWEHANFI